jgi:hypothetical protein
MEATLGISVQLSLSQTSKNAVFIIFCVFSSTKSKKRAEQVLPGSGVWGEVAQTVYIRVSKYKN